MRWSIAKEGSATNAAPPPAHHVAGLSSFSYFSIPCPLAQLNVSWGLLDHVPASSQQMRVWHDLYVHQWCTMFFRNRQLATSQQILKNKGRDF